MQIVRHDPKLIRYDKMVDAIEAAVTVDEAKQIRDQAIALEAYARQAMDFEQQRKVTEIRLRAERRAGELLKETARVGQRQTRGNNKKLKSLGTTSLSDYGISRNQSSDWQKLADVPKPLFEKLVKELYPSTEGILRAAAPAKTKTDLPPDAIFNSDALDVHCCITAFKDRASKCVLSLDPKTIVRDTASRNSNQNLT